MAPDVNGMVRRNFMVCIAVEGTPYVVAAICYPDEFTAPAQMMEVRAKKLAVETRNIIGGILVVTLLLIGLVVSLYGHRLAGRIKDLTAAAERISVGELDVEIEKKMPNDEIGDLANAFGRMQDSIRLSIERLRKRRSSSR
jgi:HAMP domain-containing protein